MSNPAVIVAIRDHLLAVPGLPDIIMPNDAKRVDTPFLTFDNGPIFNTPLHIDGEEFFDMRPNVAMHEEAGKFTHEGDAALWAVAQAFKIGTRIFLGTTEVARCLQTPVADSGQVQGGIFRRNMILRIASYQNI